MGKKLIPMVQFVIELYDSEPMNKQDECIERVVNYAKFLDSDIEEWMFIGENKIFDGFTKCTPKYAEEHGINKSFDNFGDDEFYMRIFQERYKIENKEISTFVTHFHLKKIEQLTTFGLTYTEK